ncbi:hypothetical protein LBUL_0886 [Lactobacillus delbrueckii subsp. bulgaricus ATCC BAA-365]|jgi:hypothetical protein|nr:hypothetical protein LBUL_0886 [Lactobacillus delbrueckii subsp. bulgaricus ATCC BAA-365]
MKIIYCKLTTRLKPGQELFFEEDNEKPLIVTCSKYKINKK